MKYALSKEQTTLFRERGYHFPLDVLGEEEAARALSNLRTYEHAVGQVGGPLFEYRFWPKMHLLTCWANDLVCNARILDAVQSIIGPDILVWGTQVFVRKADTGESLDWHQDGLYHGMRGIENNCVRVWLALTPAFEDNGTMRYSTGSHLDGMHTHGYCTKDDQSGFKGEEILVDIAPETEVKVVLRAGQASMHSMLVAHASGVNVTDSDRVNFAIDYLTPEVVPEGLTDSALLVRGADPKGNFKLEQAPNEDLGKTELKQFLEATTMRVRRLNHLVLTAHQEEPPYSVS